MGIPVFRAGEACAERKRGVVRGRWGRMQSRSTNLWRAGLPALVLASWLLAPHAAGQTLLLRPGSAPPPLVVTDSDDENWLAEADELLAEGRTQDALRAYQALLGRQQTFIRVGSNNFVALGRLVNERLGKLPADGIAQYRMLYDGQAQALYEQAGDPFSAAAREALQRIVREYYHTAYGDRAVDLLACVQFDRGRFSQAALRWDQLLHRTSPPSLGRELLLAKSAVAWHLAGVPSLRDKRLEELRTDFGEAEAVVGGRRQNVPAYAAAICGLPAPAWVGSVRVVQDGWASLGGAADGLAVMADCDAVFVPHWRNPGGQIEPTPEVQGLTQGVLTGGPFRSSRYSQEPPKLEFNAGRFEVSVGVPNRPQDKNAAPVPPLTHAAVAGDLALVRREDGVYAYDVVTGQLRWRTLEAGDGLPMFRRLDGGRGSPNVVLSSGFYVGGMTCDLGRYGLTVGDGMVFALCEFVPPSLRLYAGAVTQTDADLSNNSKLVAISIEAQGKLLWEVGRGLGDGEVVTGGSFLSLPTCVDGRLYAVMKFAETYHLVCLDARNGGRLLWEAVIGQTPVSPYYNAVFTNPLSERGSPPAVADGRVFVTTNAGLVAAFDAESGQGLWSYQYESEAAGVPRAGLVSPPGSAPFGRGPNPLIVAGHRLLALPADSGQLLCLNVEDGSALWTRSCEGQENLSALWVGGKPCALLSGPDLVACDLEGNRLWGAGGGSAESLEIFGRPAVTESMIFASGRGRVIRVRIDGEQFHVESFKLAQSDAVLGNLVSVGSSARGLLAANGGLLCMYMGFEEAYRQIGLRLEQADEAAQARLLLDRGLMAMHAERADLARGDLERACALAVTLADDDLAARVGQSLRRIYLRLADESGDLAAMSEWFALAEPLAESPSARCEMRVRRLRLCERAGSDEDLARAVDIAHELAELGDEVQFRDVAIGREAIDMAPEDSLPAASGYVIGQRHIARLIELYGRDVYARHDALADAALLAGRQADDGEALLAAHRRYRHSRCADALLFAAAEQMYNAAVARPPAAKNEFREAEALLRQVEEGRDESLRLPATVGQALIRLRLAPATAHIFYGGRFPNERLGERVKFGDFDGTLGELLQRIEAGKDARPESEPPEPLGRVRSPLEEVYRLDDPRAEVLRDCHGRPLRLTGDDQSAPTTLLLVRGSAVVCLDGRADQFERGVLWQAEAAIDAETLAKATAPGGRRLIGHLFAEQASLAVCDRRTLTVIDVLTGRIVRQQSLADLAVGDVEVMYAHGPWMFAVEKASRAVKCIDLRSLQVVWQSAPADSAGAAAGIQLQAAGHVLLHCETTYAGPRPGEAPRRSVRCYDLARRGRLVLSLAVSTRAQAALTPGGMLVLLDQHRLSLFDPWASGERELFARAGLAPADQSRAGEPVLIGLGSQYAAVGSPQSRTVLFVELSRSFRTACQADVPEIDGRGYYPLLVSFDGARAYVTCGANPPGVLADLSEGRCHALLPAVMAVSLSAGDSPAGAALWPAVRLPEADGGGNYECRPAAGGVEHLAMVQRPAPPEGQAVWLLMNKTTGQIVQEGKLAGQAAPAEDAVGGEFRLTRHRALGQPVLLDGRMVVETGQGILLLGTRGQP